MNSSLVARGPTGCGGERPDMMAVRNWTEARPRKGIASCDRLDNTRSECHRR